MIKIWIRQKKTFNYRSSKAWRMIECTFGILVSKWRCLKTELQINFIIICLLYNIIIDKEGLDETLLGEGSS